MVVSAASLGDGLNRDDGAAVLGRVVAGQDLDLGNELVVRHVHHAGVVSRVVQVRAVERDAEVLGAGSVDTVRVARGAEAVGRANAFERTLVWSDDAGQDSDQLGGVAADDRDALELLRGDQALAGAVGVRDHLSAGHDVNGFTDFADLELDGERRCLVCAEA